ACSGSTTAAIAAAAIMTVAIAFTVIGEQFRHCERSDAIQLSRNKLDCFVALLLAMTSVQFFSR
ncbi:MAG: hypothetical protein ABIS28_14105, partial [Caldimonas sp.]